MKQNFIIFFFIIIICIIIFGIYFSNSFKNNDKKNNDESFTTWDSGIKPNFVTNYENINFNVKPNYKNENITEYNFKRLFNKLTVINKEKIKLKDATNYTTYTQSTTDDKLRMDLDIISKYVILLLNDDKYYDFNKTNFGDVEMWIDKAGNEEIKYELFMWDKKNYFEVKLWVHIIKFVEENEIEKYGVKEKKYIFPDYNIGLPFKDQIIPLPDDVIITGHFDTSLASIKPNIPSKIKYLYLNQIDIQNSTLVVDYHKDKYPFNRLEVDETGFSGVTDMSLDYIKIKNGSHNPYLENGRKYNQWPTLDEELKWKGQYPSKFPPIKHWDDDGIYYYKNKSDNSNDSNDNRPDKIIFTKDDTDKRLCDAYEPGTRWSQDKEPLQPDFWVSNYVLPKGGETYWQFDLSQGPVGGNTFIGGGKR